MTAGELCIELIKHNDMDRPVTVEIWHADHRGMTCVPVEDLGEMAEQVSLRVTLPG